MAFDVQWVREAARDYPGILKQVTPRFLEEASIIVQAQAKADVPVDSGNLKGSINRENFHTHAEVGTNVEYGPDVEYGTRPHVINSPVKIRDVGWRYIGEHPGTEAQPFMRPAIDKTRKKLTDLLGQMIIAGMVRGRG